MVELKFRYWDGFEMVYNATITSSGQIVVLDSNGIAKHSEPNAIIMQFTGLRDKNGKDIYVGDIIKGYDGAIYRIYSTKGGFVMNIGVKMWQKDIEFDREPIPSAPLAEMQTRGWLEDNGEVIGNVHENRELLTDRG